MTDCTKYEPIFGAWYIKKKLGAGSFGEVYEIERKEFGKTYRSALKVMSVPFSDDEVRAMMADGTDLDSIATYYEGVVKDIAQENAIMSELRGNSHIVSYEDHQIIPHEDGIGYDILIRMELLTSLIDHLLHHPMTERDVIKLGKDLCQALIVCEQKKIIHRDIKPGNIFLSDTGDYKLGDFGIARSIEKSTGELSRKGTYTYMAPEVYKGEKYGIGADIYSLGMVMYYLLNGRRMPFLPLPPEPVTYNQKMDALQRRMDGEPFPAPLEGDPMLAEIVMTACAYRPEDRFQSPEALLTALKSVGEGGTKALRHSAAKADPSTLGRTPVSAEEERTELLRESTATSGTGSQPVYSPIPPAGAATYDSGDRTILDTGQFDDSSYGGIVARGYQEPSYQTSPQPETRSGKSRKILLIAAAVIVILAGGFFGMKLMGGGDEEASEDTNEASKVTLTTEDIEVIDSDINYSQLGAGNYQGWTISDQGVDVLIRVSNHGSQPLRAFTYQLKQKGAEEPLINRDSGSDYNGTQQFLAIGYVDAGETGLMYTKLILDQGTKSKQGKIKPVEIVADGTLGDYSCPTGRLIEHNETADTYPVKVSNDNDEPIHAGATVLLLRKNLSGANSLGANWGAGTIDKEIGDATKKLKNEIYNPDIDDPKTPDQFDVIVYDPYYLADPDFPADSEEESEE
ncbi:MAG: protein kinase [Firmicutes bacterium]|nr:protein kinase [Bacillota bacterium]